MIRTLIAAIFLMALAIGIGAQSARVITDKARLRGRPADDGKVVDTLTQNADVQLIKVSGLWYLVQSKDYAGWMFVNDLEIQKQPPTVSLDVAAPKKAAGADPAPAQSSSGGKTYIRGSRGGCYYLSGSGSKVYVARDLCN